MHLRIGHSGAVGGWAIAAAAVFGKGRYPYEDILFTVLFAPYCILKLLYSAIRLSSRKCVNKLSDDLNP